MMRASNTEKNVMRDAVLFEFLPDGACRPIGPMSGIGQYDSTGSDEAERLQ